MLMNTAGGARSVPPALGDVARTLRLSQLATLRKIIVPSTAAAMLVGARLALATTLVICVVAEMLGLQSGIGNQLVLEQNGCQSARMWAYILVIGALGILLNFALVRAGAGALPRGRCRFGAEPRMSLRSLRGLIPIAALLGLWQIVGNPNSATAPAPSSWWPAFKTIEQSGALWPALEKTMLLYVEGLVIATVLGVVLGMALGSSRRVAQALGPLLRVHAGHAGRCARPWRDSRVPCQQPHRHRRWSSTDRSGRYC